MSWKKDDKEFIAPLVVNGVVWWHPTEAQLTEAGYIWEAPVSVTLAPRTTCSPYELLVCLESKFPDLFLAFKEALTTNADIRFWWDAVKELDRNNTHFKAMCTQLGVTDEQLDAIFAAISGIDESAIVENGI